MGKKKISLSSGQPESLNLKHEMSNLGCNNAVGIHGINRNGSCQLTIVGGRLIPASTPRYKAFVSSLLIAGVDDLLSF